MEQLIHAPKLNAENLPWFNSRTPLDLTDFKGKLVILDFWTYCCINCIHVLPTLKHIEQAFSDSVIVVGVHSPKFSGEKNTENLEHAILRYEIEHPVVQDVDFSIWKNYAVRAWPTLVLIGPDGYVLEQIAGEPDPYQLFKKINEMVGNFRSNLIGNAGDLISVSKKPQPTTLSYPGKIAYSLGDREFAIADSNHNQIVTANREGEITRRIGSGKPGLKDGDFMEAEFFRPQGLCFQEGIIWVADTENHALRKINLKKQKVETVAGNGKQGRSLKRGNARVVELSSPWDVSLSDGWLYFANAGTHQIGVLHANEGTVEPFAGTGSEALIDGPRFFGAFAQPSGLSVGENKLFLADSETSAIRSVRLDDFGFIATYIGKGLFDFGDCDGKGKKALLQHPLGVHYSKGKVYIADSYNHRIKVLDLKTQKVTTLKASVDIVCDDKSCTRLWEPAGVFEFKNNLYVSDTNNHRILKIDLESGKAEIFIA
ncbi:MAG: thioredoxin-like domain-containing protein [Nitrospinota bacterium]